ncbi:MAG: hypothetical protein RL375_2103 [Pseudomonadota bacterium]|jgi:predicted enzyme related to lactoylglutathione lyase
MSTVQGQHVWYELMTTDLEAAQAFYTQVVGWDSADSGMPGIDYRLMSAGPAQVAGMMTLPQEACDRGARPGWLGYVAVDDVDAKAAELQQAGGALHKPPEDIPGVGRFAVVADPGGATFCLFTGLSAEAPPSPPAGTPGMMGWHELQAGDLAREWDFYSTLFGWTQDTAMDMGALGIYQMFKTGGADAAGGMMTRLAEVPHPFWLYYVNVDAIDAAVARIDAAGGRVIGGPMEVPGGSWIVNALDPQGAVFALVAPRR